MHSLAQSPPWGQMSQAVQQSARLQTEALFFAWRKTASSCNCKIRSHSCLILKLVCPKPFLTQLHSPSQMCLPASSGSQPKVCPRPRDFGLIFLCSYLLSCAPLHKHPCATWPLYKPCLERTITSEDNYTDGFSAVSKSLFSFFTSQLKPGVTFG